jgi:hypothetical protein
MFSEIHKVFKDEYILQTNIWPVTTIESVE